MTVALTSLPSLLNIFLLDSFTVYFYCVRLVYIRKFAVDYPKLIQDQFPGTVRVTL